ncbi:fatty acid synthase-like [Vespula maculifrons]|uniref:Fatty acid synthase-like n=1 Tax=Vespula maculifrons TaxID=7453 RepID=A0ABD2CT53_VESMC
MSNPKTEINNGLPDNNLFRFVTAFLRIEVVEMRMQKELTVTKWKKNWVTFMDNVMQMIIIDLETTDLFEFVVNKDNRSTEKLDSPIVWDTSDVLLLAEINVNVFTFPSKLGSEDIPKDVTILESYMTEMDGGFLLFPKNRNKSLDILILQELELRIVSEKHTSVEFRILSKKKKKIPENMMIIKVHSNDLTDRKKCILYLSAMKNRITTTQESFFLKKETLSMVRGDLNMMLSTGKISLEVDTRKYIDYLIEFEYNGINISARGIMGVNRNSGLGGFGLELVDLLILRNAQNISLILRNVIEYGYQHMRMELWQSNGVSFKNLICLYASKRDGCKLIVKTALSK